MIYVCCGGVVWYMCVAEVRGVVVGVVWYTCGTVVLWYCGTV